MSYQKENSLVVKNIHCTGVKKQYQVALFIINRGLYVIVSGHDSLLLLPQLFNCYYCFWRVVGFSE